MARQNENRQAIRTLLSFGSAHKALLCWGVVATAGVVLFRILLPWPLRGMLEVLFLGPGHPDAALSSGLDASGNPVLFLGGLYVLAALGLGITELFQRVLFVRFASRIAQGLRACAVQRCAGRSSRTRLAPAELIAWIVGAAAQIKSGVSGILIHGLQGAMFFAAVSAVIGWFSFQLGMLLAMSGLLALALSLQTSASVNRRSGRHHRKEGEFAVALQELFDQSGTSGEALHPDVPADKEAKTTRLIATSSLAVHTLLAATIGIALWLGVGDVKGGTLKPGELFLFVAYATTLHRSVVKVGRQAARSGKVLACVQSLDALFGLPNSKDNLIFSHQNLTSSLRLEAVKVPSAFGRAGRPRLRRTNLSLTPGSRIAVIGPGGSGKSTLLQVLAGVEPSAKGRIYWDGNEVSEEVLMASVGYLAQEPAFSPAPVRRLLGLDDSSEPSQPDWRILESIGAAKLIRDFPRGLDEEVGSACLSRNEARTLALASVLLGSRAAVWVLDSPMEGLKAKKACRRLEAVLGKSSGRTLIMSFSRPVGLDRFDRILYLSKGRIQFDGHPSEWTDPEPLELQAAAGSAEFLKEKDA